MFAEISHTQCFQQHLSATDPDRERSSSPWTLSYSVTGLKLASALEDQAVAKDGESIEHGSFIIETQAPVRFCWYRTLHLLNIL
jgi:hypothetical protein